MQKYLGYYSDAKYLVENNINEAKQILKDTLILAQLKTNDPYFKALYSNVLQLAIEDKYHMKEFKYSIKKFKKTWKQYGDQKPFLSDILNDKYRIPILDTYELPKSLTPETLQSYYNCKKINGKAFYAPKNPDLIIEQAPQLQNSINYVQSNQTLEQRNDVKQLADKFKKGV